METLKIRLHIYEVTEAIETTSCTAKINGNAQGVETTQAEA